MAAYATVDEFKTYSLIVPDADIDTDGERLLEAAQRDIDRLAGTWTVESNGLKFGAPRTTNEKKLTAAQRTSLSRATCAQAEYRFVKGEDWFAEDQYRSVSGPDFSTQGIKRRIGPKAREELVGSGLVVVGRSRAVL